MEVVEAGGLPSDLERRVMAAVKAAEERGDPPLLRAVEAARCFQECGLGIPSTELARVLVSNLCFANNNPSLWKLLDQAMASRVVSPIHTIALLMPRVIPCRREQPEAYRLYLELLTRYALSTLSFEAVTCRDKITKAIDDAMKLSETYKVQEMDFGHVIVLFYFSIISSLIDCSIEDCSCLLVSADKYGSAFVNGGKLATELDVKSLNEKVNERRDHLRQSNALMAIEVAEKVTSNKKSKAFLRLISINMPERFNDLLRRLQILDANISTTLPSQHVFDKLSTNIKKAISKEFLLDKHKLLGALVNARSCSLNSSTSFGAGKDACWIPIDIFMENAMDGKNLYAVSAVEILAELTKTLQEINQASWHETFQALWVSALRLIQRDREPLEGPVPHLDARLCMLLSIVPLTIAAVVKEEDEGSYLSSNSFVRMSSHGNRQNKIASRSHGLISSLQILGQFSVLLLPPPSVANAANNAATKAAIFVSNLKSGNSNPNGGRADSSIKAVGNMLHLIVEACIARNLIDTSAYFWPGYIVPSALSKDSTSFQESPWSTFLKGAPLTNSLKNSLMMTPASSLPEVDKMYHIAVNGTDEEKSAAAKILCGASLVRGWNIQEHVVHFVFKLLTPHPDSSASGARNHFIDHMPVLSAVLFGVCCVDTVHILSLYGMIPEVAAALMPLCETFGSLSPLSTHRSNNSEEISVYSVFSCAFLFLLRLWKFYKPSQEYCVAGREGSVRMELTLDYLLLMRNSRIALQNSSSMKMVDNNLDPFKSLQSQPVYIDSFPKLRAWYFQNQACIASTLSGMCSNNPAHQVANMILNMVYGKTSKGESVSGNSTPNTSSSINVSTITTTEESYQRPMVPAWDILEAVPFVLEAILTACAHGKLSSRDLTTGLRDLVDFLPASLATIISYFSAEITRGIWKPVPMNGTDWPSPAPTLLSIESEIKEILASAGVHIKSSYPHGLPPMLPLPMAVLVSLTITFKLDKSLEYINGIVGQALENCATASTWPSMPIIGALWTQKVRRWHDFIVLSCSRSPFSTEKDAIVELIRSCFSSFLGPLGARESQSTTMRGVAGLLGPFMADQGARLPIAPGFLYLRTCRNFHSPHFFNEVIFKLVIEYAHRLAIEWGSGGPARLKSSRTSLATAALGIQEAATLGASLLFIAGGVQLVQVVYEETVPTLLLSPDEAVKLGGAGPILNILLGYALAYMLILCGALVWGFGNTCPHTSVFSARRARVIGIHMDLIAGGMEGTIMLGCDPATWKAYVLCFVGLLVNFAPAWIPEVKQETLHKLASGLKGWQECDLALSLLELGGPPSMTAVVESVL